jgi:adenine-specific DNA methylase
MSDQAPPYPKRLIEVDLPIARISAHARREKSIRHGHISTLHIWWARRPLAACRAVICAALWPDPVDQLCPPRFRNDAFRILSQLRKRVVEGGISPDQRVAIASVPRIYEPKDETDFEGLRRALFDFIAEFANWDLSTNSFFLDTSRALTQSAHESLGGEPGTRPLVADPFAGGGAIPLESLRVGADAFASDLNPLAILLNRSMLELIPKHGEGLASEVREWGQRIRAKAEEELSNLYPKDPDGSVPIAYLWARTIRCEGPGCGIELPLIGMPWLARGGTRSIGLAVTPDRKNQRIDVAVVQGGNASEVSEPIVKRGSATCPACGYSTPIAAVRNQLKKKRGGSKDARLIAVATTKPGQQGRTYRTPTELDLKACENAAKRLDELVRTNAGAPLLPDEPTPLGEGSGAGRAFSQRKYGMSAFTDIYTQRQLCSLLTLCRLVNESAGLTIPEHVRPFLALMIGRVSDLSSTLCRWVPKGEFVASANGGQNRMPVLLDFAETNPIGTGGGNCLGQIDWIARVIEHISRSSLPSGHVVQGAAQIALLPSDSADALITDPPYYDAFPYSDLSDFFFVWLKRALPDMPSAGAQELVPKKEEIVVYDVPHGDGDVVKDNRYFSEQMTKSLDVWRDVTKPSGIGLVVFANKTTEGWEAILQSMIDGGWIATASWPIDTERPNRQRAIGSAALGSSVHVICRPRETPSGDIRSDDVGDWRDILVELPHRIHEWLPKLAQEGVVGADAIFACLGPALEVFSRYSRVEKSNGDIVALREYLEHVWAAVSHEALTMIFKDADAAGLEPDARLTAMWLWTLSASPANGNGTGHPDAGDDGEDEAAEDDEAKPAKVDGFLLEFDAARKIAQGLGIHLEKIPSVVEVKGDKARLLPVAERTRYLFGKEAAEPVAAKKKPKKKDTQLTLFAALQDVDAAEGVEQPELKAPQPGSTVLDRVHQAMILFAAGRGEALKRFLVEEGIGRDGRFWKLAQSLSALYPSGIDEKRWVDGVLARKKSLGL